MDEKKRDCTKGTLEIGGNVMEALPAVNMLGFRIDDKINFNLDIINICRTAGNQLNALIRLKRFLSF